MKGRENTMNDKEILDLLIDRMHAEGYWFTTKNDPTYEEAPSYFELDEYGDPTEKSQKQIVKEIKNYVGDGAVDISDAIEIWITDNSLDHKIWYEDNLVTQFKAKPVVDQIDAFENSVQLTEGAARRLQEENNKSKNLISQMFADDSFDSDSKQGQIVMRTSELFNALSSKGYDVQVSFDNGESQNVILLGQQGGKVIITITNTDQPLRAFASGNFEITDENIRTLSDIIEQISAL